MGDDEDPVATFTDTYLSTYGLDPATDLAAELQSLNKGNITRDNAYKARIDTGSSQLIPTFKWFRLPTERYLYPDIPSQVKSLKQTAFLLNGDRNTEGTLAWLYAQNPSTKTPDRTTDITALKTTVEQDRDAIVTYFATTLKVQPSDAVATYAANLTQALTACTTSNPYYTDILKPLSEQVLSGTYNPLIEPLGSMCEHYGAFFKLKRTDPSSVLKKLTAANGGMRTQLKNALDIVNNKLAQSALLGSEVYDISETFLSSGATILQARLIALDIAGQCSSAYAILLQILTACKERMPAIATGDGSQEQLIADRLHLMTISDPSVLTLAGMCQSLREITINKTTSTRFYSDTYAFNVKTTTRNSDATIVEGTVQKFIADTQDSQGLLVALMREIPEITDTDEIKNLAPKIGVFYLLYTAFNNQDDFNYSDTLTKQFPGTKLASSTADSSDTSVVEVVDSINETNTVIKEPKSQTFSCNVTEHTDKKVAITAAEDTDLATVTAIACSKTDWTDSEEAFNLRITINGTEKYSAATSDDAKTCTLNLDKATDSPPADVSSYTVIYTKEAA